MRSMSSQGGVPSTESRRGGMLPAPADAFVGWGLKFSRNSPLIRANSCIPGESGESGAPRLGSGRREADHGVARLVDRPGDGCVLTPASRALSNCIEGESDIVSPDGLSGLRSLWQGNVTERPREVSTSRGAVETCLGAPGAE